MGITASPQSCFLRHSWDAGAVQYSIKFGMVPPATVGRHTIGNRLAWSARWTALMTFGLTVHAADWPQWGRTTERNMYSPEKGLAVEFNPGQLKSGGGVFDAATARNLKWIAKLGSSAYGNVTVAEGRVVVGTNNEPPRDPKCPGDRSILLCLDTKTGAFLWQLVVPKLSAGKANDWEGLGILSSPTHQEGRIYLVTSRCELMCLTSQGLGQGNTGPFVDEAQYMAGPGQPKIQIGPNHADIVWLFDMFNELAVFPHNAANCAPLILGDLVYACTSNGQDWTHANVPFPEAPTLIAVDRKTGRFVAQDDARIGERLFHGQWSSPSSGVVNGKRLVFLGGGDGWCYGFDAQPDLQSHQLKTVWKCDCNPADYRVKDGQPAKYPSAEGPSEVNNTPVFYNNQVYAAIGQDPENGEGVGALSCVDATQSGDISKTGLVWRFDKIGRCISTVSIDPETGLLFVGDFSGFVYCLDAATGQLYWQHDMKAHIWGSTLVADGKVYVGDEDGDVRVLAAAKEKKLLSEVNLGAPVYGTPIIADGVIYIQSSTHLFAFQQGAKPVAP